MNFTIHASKEGQYNNSLEQLYREIGPRIDTAYTVTVAIVLSPIIVLGIIGNFFSLLVWIKGRRRKTSTARYLSALAIADGLVLASSALDYWVVHVLHVDLRSTSSFLCKFLYFISFYGPALSAWILMYVTAERALSVWIPHKIGIACRPLTAYLVIGLTSILLFFAYLSIMIGVDVVTVYSQVLQATWKSCQALQRFSFAKNTLTWFWLDLCLYFLVPFLVIVVCNTGILIRICMLERKKQQNLQAQGQQKKGTQSKSSRMMSTVTVRIVALSLTFFVCVAPLSILNILMFVPSFAEVIKYEHVNRLKIPFHCLMYLNNGVNFLLYCVIGSGFRKDLKGIFRRGSSSSVSR